MRGVWITVAILIVCSAWADSAPQQQKPDGASSTNNIPNSGNVPANNTSSTGYLNAVVPKQIKVEVTGHLDGDADKSKKHSDNKENGFWNRPSITDWMIVFFAFCSVVVAAIQACIYCGQKRIMREALKATNRQIDLARDEFTAIHRPKIRIRHFNVHLGDIAAYGLGPTQSFSWSMNVSNVGGTPIKVISVSYAAGWSASIESAIERFYSDRKPLPAIEDELLSGRRTVINFPSVVIENIENIVRTAEGFFYVIGEVRYTDVVGINRITGFFRRCKHVRAGQQIGEFEIVPNADYEYED